MRKTGIIIVSLFLLFVCAEPLIAQDYYKEGLNKYTEGAHKKPPSNGRKMRCSPECRCREFTFIDGSTIGINNATGEVMYYGYRTTARFPGFRYPNKDKLFDSGSPIMGYRWIPVTDPQMKERLKKLYLEQISPAKATKLANNGKITLIVILLGAIGIIIGLAIVFRRKEDIV